MIYYTYKIICTEGKWKDIYYFGKHKTKDIDDGYICSSKKLYYYLKKHPNGYIRTILCFYDSLKELNEAEKILIAPCLNDPKCANIAKGGDGGDTGYWRDPEYKKTEAYKKRCEKLSIAAKKRWANYSCDEREKICKNMSKNYVYHYCGHPGRVQSDSEKQKRSKSLIGKKVSDETRKKMSDAWKNIDPIKRKERIEKIRNSIIGFKHSEESRQKMSKSRLGKKSPHKGKIGISKGKIKTYIFEEQLDNYIKLGYKKGFK